MSQQPPQNPYESEPSGETPPPPSQSSAYEANYPSPGGYGPPMPPPPPGEVRPAFSATAAIGYGWRVFKNNPGSFLGLSLAMLVVAALFSSIARSFDAPLPEMLVIILGQAVSYLFGAALIKGAVDAASGKPVSIASMFQGWDKVQVMVASILLALGTSVGILLLVIPGLIFAFLTSFTMFFIVDDRTDLDAVGAIKASINLVKNNAGDTFVFALVSFGVALLGMLALLVGVFIAIPVIYAGAAYAYRVFQGEPVAVQN